MPTTIKVRMLETRKGGSPDGRGDRWFIAGRVYDLPADLSEGWKGAYEPLEPGPVENKAVEPPQNKARGLFGRGKKG